MAVPDLCDCLSDNTGEDKSAHWAIQPRPVSVQSMIELSSRRKAVESAVGLFERAAEHVEVRLRGRGRELSAGIDRTGARI